MTSTEVLIALAILEEFGAAPIRLAEVWTTRTAVTELSTLAIYPSFYSSHCFVAKTATATTRS